MSIVRKISPPYLQFFISDIGRPENPTPDVESIRIIFNGRCISVPCAYHEEAGTELVVGTPEEVAQATAPQFDGIIPTPGELVLFDDAEATEWVVYPTPTAETRIRIWTDGSILPERVVVAVG